MRRKLASEYGARLDVVRIPAHAGFYPNMVVDAAAKAAALEGTPVDINIVTVQRSLVSFKLMRSFGTVHEDRDSYDRALAGNDHHRLVKARLRTASHREAVAQIKSKCNGPWNGGLLHYPILINSATAHFSWLTPKVADK